MLGKFYDIVNDMMNEAEIIYCYYDEGEKKYLLRVHEGTRFRITFRDGLLKSIERIL